MRMNSCVCMFISGIIDIMVYAGVIRRNGIGLKSLIVMVICSVVDIVLIGDASKCGLTSSNSCIVWPVKCELVSLCCLCIGIALFLWLKTKTNKQNIHTKLYSKAISINEKLTFLMKLLCN